MYLFIATHISYNVAMSVAMSVTTSGYGQIQSDVYNSIIDSLWNLVSLSTSTPVRNSVAGSVGRSINLELYDYQFDNCN